MGANKKISELENNASSFVALPNGTVAIFNNLTKELKHLSIDDFQTAFGLDDHQFIVGNYTGQDLSGYKFSVFGDTKVEGSLSVDSSWVGQSPSGAFTGFYLDSNLYTKSIKNVESPLTRIDISGSGISFLIQDKDFLNIESGVVNLNREQDSNFTFKTFSTRPDVVNNTAFAVDASESGGVGIGTDELSADFQVEGKRILLNSELGGLLNSDKSIAGFSALGGHATGDRAVAFQSGSGHGTMSFAIQRGNAIGDYSFADGYDTSGSGDYSAAHGMQTLAKGDYSHAEGYQTQALGVASHAEGANTKAHKNYSHAEGSGTDSSGIASHAEGLSTLAEGNYSHAEGSGTKAYGEASHAEGILSEASGQGAHAEGYGTVSSGEAAHAQGFESRVIGNYSSANGYRTNVTGDNSYGQGRNCQVSGDSAQAEGFNSQATADESFAIGVDAHASQRAEHARSAGRNVGVTKSQISRYFGLDHQSGYTLDQKYPLYLANESGLNIQLESGGTYNIDVSIVGRGRILDSARVAGESVNWNYRIKGNLAVSTGDYLSFNTAPYVYTTPMSPLWGGVIPVNDWTPIEPYIVTDLEIVSTPNQYCEIPGFTPYVEFDTGNLELEVGVVRSEDWSFFEIGSILAGNESGTGQYAIYPSVIFTGKNGVLEDLTFDDISGVFAKDADYFSGQYSGYVLDTGAYDIYTISGTGLGSIVPPFDINYEGPASKGESDLLTVTAPLTGFSGICYGNIGLDCEIYWHSITDINMLVSPIATPTGSGIIINC